MLAGKSILLSRSGKNNKILPVVVNSFYQHILKLPTTQTNAVNPTTTNNSKGAATTSKDDEDDVIIYNTPPSNPTPAPVRKHTLAWTKGKGPPATRPTTTKVDAQPKEQKKPTKGNDKGKEKEKASGKEEEVARSKRAPNSRRGGRGRGK